MSARLVLEQERVRRAEMEVIQWAVAVVRRPNADHRAHDRHLRDSVEEYENAVEALRDACGHPNAFPVSSPRTGLTEYRCEECDCWFTREDAPADEDGGFETG